MSEPAMSKNVPPCVLIISGNDPSGGAGIQAAETVAGGGAKVLLTGYVGPKAFQALSAAGIAIVQNIENMTVRQAIEKYKSGGIDTATAPNRRGHGR